MKSITLFFLAAIPLSFGCAPPAPESTAETPAIDLKSERDALMERYDTEYPGYDFASHKGYATSAHRDAIRRLGPSPIHRRSFTLLPHPKLWD